MAQRENRKKPVIAENIKNTQDYLSLYPYHDKETWFIAKTSGVPNENVNRRHIH